MLENNSLCRASSVLRDWERKEDSPSIVHFAYSEVHLRRGLVAFFNVSGKGLGKGWPRALRACSPIDFESSFSMWRAMGRDSSSSYPWYLRSTLLIKEPPSHDARSLRATKWRVEMSRRITGRITGRTYGRKERRVYLNSAVMYKQCVDKRD